jgi:hypothetical protein
LFYDSVFIPQIRFCINAWILQLAFVQLFFVE